MDSNSNNRPQICRWYIILRIQIFGSSFFLFGILWKVIFDGGCRINGQQYPAGSKECTTAGYIGAGICFLLGICIIISAFCCQYCCCKNWQNASNSSAAANAGGQFRISIGKERARNFREMSPRGRFMFGVIFFPIFGIAFCSASILFFILFSQNGCRYNGQQLPKGSQECINAGIIGGSVFLSIGIGSLIAGAIWAACFYKKFRQQQIEEQQMRITAPNSCVDADFRHPYLFRIGNERANKFSELSPRARFMFGAILFPIFGIVFCSIGIILFLIISQLVCPLQKNNQNCMKNGIIGGGVFFSIGIASLIAGAIWAACFYKKFRQQLHEEKQMRTTNLRKNRKIAFA